MIYGFYLILLPVFFILNLLFMKKIIFIAAISTLFISACTKSAVESNNGSNINSVVDASAGPLATKTSFSNEFIGASGIEWQRNSSNSFTVQFNQSNQRHDACYDDSGHRSSHSIICINAPVLQVVLDAFRLRFPTDNVYEWKLNSDNTWKAHFLRSGVKYEATFSATGTLLKFEKSA